MKKSDIAKKSYEDSIVTNETRPIRNDNPEHDQIIKDGLAAIKENIGHMTSEQIVKAYTELNAASQKFDHNQLCDRINSNSFQ